ncbi:TPA: capsular polysaccharide synthesis protein, partial [Streptococcus suis]
MTYKLARIKNKLIFNLLDKLPVSKTYKLSPPNKYMERIWICWLQGEEHAPKLVKCCIKSIQDSFPNHTITILTEQNISEFLTLPDHVWNRFHNNEISKTHFSDLLRMNLISQQGGLWIDATVFMTRPINNNFFNFDFNSLHHDSPSHYGVFSEFWISYFFYAKPNNKLVQYCAQLLNEYTMKYPRFHDYFIMDYCIKKSINDCGMMDSLKELPVIGINRFLLNNIANQISNEHTMSLLQ